MRVPFLAACVLSVGAFVSGCKAKHDAGEAPPPSASASASATPTATATASAPSGVLVQNIPAPPDVAAPPPDAQKTASGLVTKVLTKGSGTEHPRQQDRVKVQYTGWTKNGVMFDSSVARGGPPAVFGVGHVIPGWTEALQLMVAGEKRRLWIPAGLAYGEHPMGGAPAGDLVFDVELLEVIKAPDPPPVPEDVKAPPKTAKKTKSGLAYRVLKPGTGPHPQPTDMVSVNYSGWTTDGHMFDSSVVRGHPLTMRLNQVIKGWTEGVPLMRVGEKTRFWIPGDLAYGDHPVRPGAPPGMLVFDIELLDIIKQP